MRRLGVKVQHEIDIPPLSAENLKQLIGDSLHCGPERTCKLAQLVCENSGDNVFFAIRLLSALAKEGLLAFDYSNAGWSRHPDTVAVVKASQALSGEIELPKLIEMLMTIALQTAKADRGLLILPNGAEYRVEAEACVKDDVVEATLHSSAIEKTKCVAAVVDAAIRRHKSVIVDDASGISEVSEDFCPPRSLFCLPLLRKSKLAGVLYLENSQASGAFTADRIAMLELLAGQAAISLENARLYNDLRQREAKIRRLIDSNIIGIVIGRPDGKFIEANNAFLSISGYDRDDLISGRINWNDMIPQDWKCNADQAGTQLRTTGTYHPYQRELVRKDGRRIPVLIGGALFEGAGEGCVSFVMDLSEKREAEKRQKLLIEELNHRVKNTLATVLALSAQTFRSADSPEAFCEAFQGRLLALSQTHNLLNRSCWTGVSLRDIVTQELVPHTSKDSSCFFISGGDVPLGPVVAVTLGIAFHELVTNSAKYGALSMPGGRVSVTWEPGLPDQLRVEWRETGGPSVGLPRRRGFGTRFIEELLPGEVCGEARLDFQPQGLRCNINISLSRAEVH